MNLPFDEIAPDLSPVLDTALDAVVVMREDGVIAGWNAVAEKVFGWSREQALGSQLSSLIIPSRLREAHHRGLQKYLETGEGPVLNRHFEITALRSNGEEFPIELSITPTLASKQRVFLGFLRDITDRKVAEQIIRRRAREAEAIAQLTTLAAETTSFELVMERCLQAVCDITGWNLGHAFRCSYEEATLLIDTGIWHSRLETDISPLSRATSEIEFRSGIGLPGASLERREPVWLAELGHNPNFPRAQAAASVGLQAAFAFPILSGAHAIAILEFFHDSPTPPDPTLLPTMRTLGEQVGRVFERTRAAERLEAEREALLAEIGRRERLESQQQLLMNELNHRVKNTLAVVSGIAHQTGKSSSTVPDFVKRFSGRLTALATAHSLLTDQQWRSAPLRELISHLLGPFSEAGENRVLIEGPKVTLQPRCVVALSLIIHELLTNALKHGALSSPTGAIAVNWGLVGEDGLERLSFKWYERGQSGIKEPHHAGFGSKLLQTSVRHELKGTINQKWNDDGLELHLEFPLSDC